MNENPDFTKQIEALLAKGDLRSAIAQLKALLENSPLLDKVIQQSGRFERLYEKIHSGTISYEAESVAENQISKSILALLREIETQQLADPHLNKEVERAIAIMNSKNVNTGTANAGRDIHFGDTNNYYAAESRIQRFLTKPPFDPPLFLGRDEELKEVHDKLFGGENLLLLVNGQGGMGKTSFAAKYWIRYENEYKFLAFLYVGIGIAEALISIAEKLNLKFPEDMPIVQRLGVLIQQLANLEKPCLLILDNANDDEDLEKNFELLRSCSKFHILITSRLTEFQETESYAINPLKDDFALQLFKRHYKKHQTAEDPLFWGIFEAVGGNTLVLEILAKNLHELNQNENFYPLSQLHKDLQSKGLLQLSEQAVVKVHWQNAQKDEPEKIIEALFDLRPLQAGELYLLSNLAVLPPENISYEMLKTLLQPEKISYEMFKALSQPENTNYEILKSLSQPEKISNEMLKTLLQPENITDEMLEILHQPLDISYEMLKIFLQSEDISHEVLKTLLQPENISYEMFKILLQPEKVRQFSKSLTQLYQKGWVEKNKETEGTEYKISPVVQEIVKKKNLSLWTDCQNLIEALNKKLEYEAGAAGDLLNVSKEEAPLLVRYAESVLASLPKPNIDLYLLTDRISNFHQNTGNLEQALHYYKSGMKINQTLCTLELENIIHKDNLAVSCEKLGNTYSALGDIKAALAYYENYAKLAKERSESSPQNESFKNNLAISQEKLGNAHIALGNIETALTHYERYGELSNELYESDLIRQAKYAEGRSESSPQNESFKSNLAISHEKLGNTHTAFGNTKTALTHYEKYAELSKELSESSPQNASLKSNLAISQEKLGNAHIAFGNVEAALTHYEKYAELSKELYESFPKNVSFKSNLAISHEKLGNAYSAFRKIKQALVHYEKYAELSKELYESFPQIASFKSGLAISHEKLGNTNSALGNLEAALTFYEKNLELTKELHDSFPDHVEFKNGLAVSYSKLGIFYRDDKKDKARAKPYLQQCYTLYEELTSAHPTYAVFQNNFGWAKEALESLD